MTETLNEEAIERHSRRLIEPAATLYAVQKVYGDQAKAKAMAAYGRLIDAHMSPSTRTISTPPRASQS
jgi:hypothetical protein